MFDLEKNPKEFQSYIPNFQIQLFELSSSGEEFHSENNALYILIRLIQMIRAEPERFEKELIHLFTILSKEKEASKRIEIFFDMVKLPQEVFEALLTFRDFVQKNNTELEKRQEELTA